MKVNNIQWAVIEPTPLEYHGIIYQAELFKSYIPKLPDNMFRTVYEYDQKQDGSCVIFSIGATIWYNTGLSFTNNELRELWQEHQGDRGGDVFKSGRELWQRFILNSFPIYIDTPQCRMALDKGWWVEVEIWCDPVFLDEGLHTGFIHGVQPIPIGTKVFRHAMLLYKKDGKMFLHNSWKGLKTQWFHNIYDITGIYDILVSMKIIRPYGMMILPYSQDVYPGMRIAFKDYTRALTRAGMSVGGDIWKSFKKYAGIDGKVDPR